MDWTILGPILVLSVTGAVARLVQVIGNRKKTDADLTNVLTEAAERIVTTIQGQNIILVSQNEILSSQNTVLLNQVRELSEQVASTNKELGRLREAVRILSEEVERMGGDPHALIPKR